jgi:hypothetical protein
VYSPELGCGECAVTISRGAFRSQRSATISKHRTREFADAILALAFANRADSRPQIAMSKFSRAKRIAVAKPTPLVPPVTNATFCINDCFGLLMTSLAELHCTAAADCD